MTHDDQQKIGSGVEVDLRDSDGNPIAVFRTTEALWASRVLPMFPETRRDHDDHHCGPDKSLRGEMYVLNRRGDIHASPDGKSGKRPWKKMYTHTLQIKRGKRACTSNTKMRHVKILELYKGGKFRIWELGITMRGKQFLPCLPGRL